MAFLSYFTRYLYRAWRTDKPTTSPVTTKIFEVDGLPNFLENTTVESTRRGKGLVSTRQVSLGVRSKNEGVSYVLAMRLRIATRQN